MNSNKRPADSRGNSPPRKRSRPPEPKPSRVQQSISNRARSPPRAPFPPRPGPNSRLPGNIPTGPRKPNEIQAIDTRKLGVHKRTSTTANTPAQPQPASNGAGSRRSSVIHSPHNVASPTNISSRGSTPTLVAPPVPSMLQNSNQSLNAPNTLNNVVAHSMETLRQIKLRKQAVVPTQEPHAERNNDTTLSDILQLRRERDQLAARVQALESLPEQMKGLSERLEKLQQSSKPDTSQAATLKDLLNRIGTVEGTTKDFVGLRRDIVDLKSWREDQARNQSGKAISSYVREFVGKEIISNNTVLRKATTDVECRLTKVSHELLKTVESSSREVDILSKEVAAIKQLELPTKFGTLIEDTQKVMLAQKECSENIVAVTTNIEKNIGNIREAYGHSDTNLMEKLEKLCSVVDQTIKKEQVELSQQQTKLAAKQDSMSLMLNQYSESIEILHTRQAVLAKDQGSAKDSHIHWTNTVTDRLDHLERRLAEDAIKATANVSDEQSVQLDKEMQSLRQAVEVIRTTSEKSVLLDKQVAIGDDRTQSEIRALGTMMEDLKDFVEQLNTALEKVESTQHGHNVTIANLPQAVRNVFEEISGLSESSVESRLTALDGKVSELRNEVPPELKVSLKNLVATQSGLQQGQADNRRDVDSVLHQLTLKADTAIMNQQMDHFRHSFKSLQNQYNNISSDELYQKIVQWLSQDTPSLTGMKQQLATVHQDLKRTHEFLSRISWVSTHSQELATLLRYSPHLKALSEANLNFEQLPQSLTKIDDAFRLANELETRFDKVSQETTTQQEHLTGVRATMSELTEFVRASSTTRDQTFNNLRVQLEASLAEEKQNRVKEINTLTSNNDSAQQRLMNEAEKLRRDLSEQISQTKQLTTSFESTTKTLRQDVDTINKYILPNQPYFVLLDRVLLAVAQLQSAVQDVRDFSESLNQNRREGPLRVEWKHDLDQFHLGRMLQTLEPPSDTSDATVAGAEAPSDSAGNGQGK